MRLLIISHTPHYSANAQILGWGPTIREIDHLCSLFDEVVHIAPLHSEINPDSALEYHSQNIRYVSVVPSGGKKLVQKLGAMLQACSYVIKIQQHLPSADMIHIRAPANIALIAMIILSINLTPRKRWIKYAGNWMPRGKDALSYRFQRWWLRHNLARTLVTVNGRWDDSPPHVRSFLNPCLTEEELAEGQLCAEDKVLTSPLRFVFVGRVEETKGVRYALEIIAFLTEKGVSARFDIIGDGPERIHFEDIAKALNVSENVVFHGWMMRHEVNDFYRSAHFILLPSYSSEGWPKVLSEAMAYGVVPLASDVSSIPQYLADFRTGRTFPPASTQTFAEAVEEYVASPAIWKTESRNSIQAAQLFSYDAYLGAVRQLLSTFEAK